MGTLGGSGVFGSGLHRNSCSIWLTNQVLHIVNDTKSKKSSSFINTQYLNFVQKYRYLLSSLWRPKGHRLWQAMDISPHPSNLPISKPI